MDELLEEMINVLNEDVKSANVIILAMDATDCRWTNGVTDMLSQLEALFGRKMWSNTVVEMTLVVYTLPSRYHSSKFELVVSDFSLIVSFRMMRTILRKGSTNVRSIPTTAKTKLIGSMR